MSDPGYALYLAAHAGRGGRGDVERRETAPRTSGKVGFRLKEMSEIAMDALAIRALTAELNRELKLARVEKIHQPSSRDIVLTLRTRAATHRLLLSAHKSFARAHLLTGERPKNPEEPPMFCMLLRKRLESGRVLEFRQQGWDRVLEMVVESTDEIGDTVYHVLILEIMGKHSNIILTTADRTLAPQRIVDSIVHVTQDMSRVRQVLPGLPYEPAPPQAKKPYHEVTSADVEALQLDGKTDKAQQLALCGLVAGIGPVTAREILHRARSKGNGSAESIVAATRDLIEGVLNGTEPVSVGLDEVGNPVEAAPFQLTSRAEYRPAASLSAAVESVYAEAAARLQMSNLARELESAVLAHIDRLRGKREKLLQERVDSLDHETFRIKGELLTAYPYLVEKGATRVALPNFYDEEHPLEIELDPAKTAIENAQHYFRLASKKKRALPFIEKELAQVEQDLQYLDTVLVHLQDANAEQLQAVRDELVKEGFLTAPSAERKRNRDQGKGKEKASGPDVYQSSDGYVILVGRNNAQNDRLTLRSSQPHDVWLHVKDTPGSHVVIRSSPGTPVPESTLAEAAMLAAYFSKAKNSANVPVDYTLVKHVWKPNGARPGFVLYDHQKTLYVTPDREKLEAIFQRRPNSAQAEEGS
jgi:predicted ribosome quality control (RQC) complex YloA/Tae2 family protein